MALPEPLNFTKAFFVNRPTDELRIDPVDFLNLFPLRCPNIMWLLGAGASVGAGAPTASTLTWEIKRQLYCAAHRLPPTRFPNLNDRIFHEKVQSYFGGLAGFPPNGDSDEYAFYFQRYLSDEADRRRYLEGRLGGVRPSYGHACLAGLLALGKVEVVWTTNFDYLVERAAAQNGIADRLPQGLSVASFDAPTSATNAIANDRWPLLVKLHGDFLYRRLTSTPDEVQKSDCILRTLLAAECGRRGLAVIGCSGRDESVMSALRAALAVSDSFPHGLFWFAQAGEEVSASVHEFLWTARGRGVQVGLVEVGGFDELMADLFLPYEEDLPAVRDIVKAQRQRRRAVMPEYVGRAWPVLRTNALEVTKYPSSCTAFQADIGGAREVKQVAVEHRDRITVGRRRIGIVGFGTRADLQRVFETNQPREFERYSIESRRLLYDDSIELGLFYDAICQALSVQTGLRRSQNHKGRILYLSSPDSLRPQDVGAFKALGINPIRRPNPKGPTIHEAVWISLEYCDKRLWLLLEPTLMITTNGTTPYDGADRSDIGREDLVRRYNQKASSLLTLWIEFLKWKCGDPLRLAFPSQAEPEAEFEVSTVTAYARQAK